MLGTWSGPPLLLHFFPTKFLLFSKKFPVNISCLECIVIAEVDGKTKKRPIATTIWR